MKAYGVPKIFGAQGTGVGNEGSTAGGNLNYMRYDGSKVNTGAQGGGAGMASVGGSGFTAGGGTYGLYQQGKGVSGKKY